MKVANLPPHAQLIVPDVPEPAVLMCRYSEDAGGTWIDAVLTEMGALGSHATVSYTGGDLVISTTELLWLSNLVAFPAQLSALTEGIVTGLLDNGPLSIDDFGV